MRVATATVIIAGCRGGGGLAVVAARIMSSGRSPAILSPAGSSVSTVVSKTQFFLI